MSARKPAAPWYRQGWPWFLIALPATAVVAGTVTAWMAIKSNDGLVVDDYYKQGLAIQKTMARGQEAATLGLSATIRLSAGSAQVELSSATGEPLPDTLFFTLAYATRANLDQTVTLVGNNGKYQAPIQPLRAGHWKLLLEDESRAWRLTGAIHLPTETEVRLIPPDK
ncbi:FixH family protein [Nitrogeniibacter mangrovi]|uniref:FixH family protein n=1 Tax=Nitrogeniibacter mangrovi TaxID=2016596 RepID=A0A6C1B0S4_9RHOO|nr:FixH family protein [Nitrogeniibacter mangrovi]QID17202.1 FixH family protein [Nitrogeniibacter mangrovi]